MPHHRQPIDLSSWVRREHYDFFRRYEDPFFSVSADVDVTRLRAAARESDGPSFSIAAFYLALRSANEVAPFRMRIEGEDVVVYDAVDGGSTILRRDGTFGFAYFEYGQSFPAFSKATTPRVEEAKRGSGRPEDRPDRVDLVYFSVLPWIAFTSFSHARRDLDGDSIPRIVFGRYREVGDRLRMPVAVDVHHALVDGIHVGEFLSLFQGYLDALPLD